MMAGSVGRFAATVSIVGLALAGCGAGSPENAATRSSAALPECQRPTLPAGFRFAEASVNGGTMHYVTGGTGPAIVLLHGFPEDSSAWIGLLETLGRSFTIVAPDLRGIGGSIAPPGAAYDAVANAKDVKELSEQLGLRRPFIVGHDMGGIVSYTVARIYPSLVRGAMLVENPLPGVAPWDEIAAAPTAWHIHFQQASTTPELLIAGREEPYFRTQFFEGGVGRRSSVTPEALSRYACAYTGGSRLAAGLGQYRGVEVLANLNRTNTSPISVPLHLVGGGAAFGPKMPSMAENLRRIGWTSVTVDQIPDASHYLVDERPADLARLISRYAATSD